MASARKPPVHTTAADSSAAVDEFMLALKHPFKDVIEAIRRSILASDRSIAEGIKWKSPSFRTSEYFATINLREKRGVGVILHLGAKVRKVPTGGLAIDDPGDVLQWLGKDRAMVVFESPADFKARKGAFQRIVKQWIAQV